MAVAILKQLYKYKIAKWVMGIQWHFQISQFLIFVNSLLSLIQNIIFKWRKQFANSLSDTLLTQVTIVSIIFVLFGSLDPQ